MNIKDLANNKEFVRYYLSNVVPNSSIDSNILYYPGGDKLANAFRTVGNVAKNIVRKTIDKEARLADSYSSKEYTFDQAYADARKKGQRTFFWDNKYYNTDYEGEHGRQYKADLESGKAKAFEEQYPNFTNPELRKEKEEELATYGITNEQTRNKSKKDEVLRRIEARGYDVSNAISNILGEYSTLKEYSDPDLMIKDINKKYNNRFNDFKLNATESVYGDGKLVFTYPWQQEIDYRRNLKADEDKELFDMFMNEVRARSNDPFSAMIGNEIHRGEYDYLLGYPANNPQNNNPIISKYKTGSLPYYYTTETLESSTPFIPNYLEKYRDDYNKRFNEYRKNVDSVYEKIEEEAKKNGYDPEWYEKFGPKDYFSEEREKEKTKHEAIYANSVAKHQKELDKVFSSGPDGPIEFLENHGYSYDGEGYLDTRLDEIGITAGEGIAYIYDFDKLLKNATEEELKEIGDYGLLSDFKEFPINEIDPGNIAAKYNERNDNYYKYGADSGNLSKGKYDDAINKILSFVKKDDVSDNNIKAMLTGEYRINSEPSLGNYTLGIPENKKFISIWDKFDIDPFGSGNDKPIIEVGKPFEYYTRFYTDGNAPDIDKIYKELKYSNGGNLEKISSNRDFINWYLTNKAGNMYDNGGDKDGEKKFEYYTGSNEPFKYVDPNNPQDINGGNTENGYPPLTKDQILNLVWQSENPKNLGLNDDGTYSKYPDPRGKDDDGNELYDVGPGLLIGSSIKEKPFYTRKELDDAAYKYNLQSLNNIQDAFDNKYGSGAFNNVDPLLKLIMLDTRYRAGTIPIEKFPKLYEAVYNGNVESAIGESRTTYKKDGARIPDNGRVVRLAEHLYPGMFNITFDKSGVHVVKKQ